MLQVRGLPDESHFLNGSTQTRQLPRSGCDYRGTAKVLLGCDSYLHILNSRVH